jgi:hypothetical protein
MKFSVMSALIGVSSAVPIKNLLEGKDQYERMSAMCNTDALAQVGSSNLLQIKDDGATAAPVTDNHGISNWVDNTKESEQAHFGKTKAEIDAENKKILDTQKQCLDFVNDHPDHPEVCQWCRDNHEPTDPWQWNPSEGVWYKYHNGNYHYWGPSKDGLQHEWSWYNGYWHHGGYVFKYENGKWHRFQGGEWHEYGEKIDIDPVAPRTKECRSVLRLEQHHVPDSLAEQDHARCQVGQGVNKALYQWTDDADCIFLGGTKIYQKNYACAVGQSEQYREVEVCVQGEKVTHEGFDYTTGQGKVVQASFNFQPTPMETTVVTHEDIKLTGAGIWRNDNTHEKLDLGVFGKTYFVPKTIQVTADWKDQEEGDTKAQLFLRLYRGEQML